MGGKTKIDWCDSTWNPVTGCRHGCRYCYARSIAKRFCGYNIDPVGDSITVYDARVSNPIIELDNQLSKVDRKGQVRPAVYPFGFTPTLHRYTLDQPSKWCKPRTIFVCSMADLFGSWIPDEWITEVFNACMAAPQHRYLFLTKNPKRYIDLATKGLLPVKHDNFWFGSTTTTPETEFFWHDNLNTFVSIEPILAPFKGLVDDGIYPTSKTNWIIIGAETGNHKNKNVPEKAWIEEIVSTAKKAGIPVFMKESLRDIMGDDFIQQSPWEV